MDINSLIVMLMKGSRVNQHSIPESNNIKITFEKLVVFSFIKLVSI